METEVDLSAADEVFVNSPFHSAPPSRDVLIRYNNQSRDGSAHTSPFVRDGAPESGGLGESARFSSSEHKSLNRRSQTFVCLPSNTGPGMRSRERDPASASNRRLNSTASHPQHASSASLTQRNYNFPAKASFDATQHLLKSRSDTSLTLKKNPDDDIWKRLPPDFRPQTYAPSPPKRNTREAMRPWTYRGRPEDYVRVTANNYNEEEAVDEENEENLEPFQARVRLPDSWDGKLDFVKHGTNRVGRYETPLPHDFRGYPSIGSLGLPEFVTASDKDPRNIHFLSNRLNKIHGLSVKSSLDRERGRQMYETLRQPPNWEGRLILPHNPFPNRYAAYTRYRIPNRSPHSALMDRIEDTLTAEWAREKMEKALHMNS